MARGRTKNNLIAVNHVKKGMACFLIVVLFILGILVIIQIRASVRESATLAAIKSIIAPLYQYKKELNLVESDSKNDWKMLPIAEYDHLISFLTKQNVKFDQGNWQPGKPLVDFWGTRYQISFRKKGNRLDFKGRSAGPDRIFGTKDDIVEE